MTNVTKQCPVCGKEWLYNAAFPRNKDNEPNVCDDCWDTWKE